LSLQSQEDCDTLDKQAKRVHDSLNDCGRKRSALAEEMRELNKRIKHLSVKIPKLGLEISSCDTTRVELTKRIPELQDQCVLSRSDEDKLSELNRKVSKCKSDMASCAMKASKLEADVARIQKAIIDAGGSLVKNQQEACEKALTTLNNAIKELNGSKVTISSSRKATEKAKNNRILAEKDLAKCDESLDQLKDELNSLEKEAMAVMVAYEKVKQIELEKRDELNSLQEEYDDLKKAHAKVKCVEMELISKQEQYSKSLKEFDKDIHLWEMEISKLNEDHLADSEFALLDEDDENDDKEMGSQSSGKLPVFNKTSLSHYVIDDVKRDISVLEKERDIISKNANMGAIAEYRKKEEDYLARYVNISSLDCIFLPLSQR
jgi:structural maintenance of chromosome 4